MSNGRATGNPGNESQYGSRPIPDPTTLTTQQLNVAIDNLRSLLSTRIDADQRLNDERHKASEQQRLEQKEDTKIAVDAALQAQKEAVREQTSASDRAIAKSEAATTKQQDQQAATTRTEIAGVNSAIGDLKERVGAIESVKQGARENTAGIYAAIGGVGAILLIVVMLVNGVFSGGA